MTAFAERRAHDIDKIRDLGRTSNGRVVILSASGNPVSKISLELRYKTAGSQKYPSASQDVTRVTIELPARYPFAEPSATITTPIYHPNVYASGRICFGIKWLPSQGLDLLVQRIIQIITFDPLILNEASPANGTALQWYRGALRAHPSSFPTDQSAANQPEAKPKISWAEVPPAPPQRTTVSCPHCSTKLSLPTGKRGKVACPKCKSSFEIST